MNASDQKTEDASVSKLRALWLAKEIPFPLDTGDHIYTAFLAKSLAEAGVNLTYLGFPPAPPTGKLPDWQIRWLTVDGNKFGKVRALFSFLPHVAATHATPRFRAAVRELARETWDFIVIDQYGMGWVLPLLHSAPNKPVLVYVSHDHEASVTHLLYKKFKGSKLMRFALWQNYLKTRRLEQVIIRNVELSTMISDHDADLFEAESSELRMLTLTPGYAGVHVVNRVLNSATPRHVLMVGSYHWTAKQSNLRRFALAADQAFTTHNIELHVVGSMPDRLANELRDQCKSIRLHGFVETLAPHFEKARIAVVPEEIGGGFKLKFLDFIFNRVPVATLTNAAKGVPSKVVNAMLCADDLSNLVATIVNHIDRLEMLNDLQQQAFEAAMTSFDWAQRGTSMLDAIVATRK